MNEAIIAAGKSDWVRACWAIGALLLLGLGLSGLWWWTTSGDRASLPGAVQLEPVTIDDAQSLAAFFVEQGYDWPPNAAIPTLAVTSLPADLIEQPIRRKKSLFFRSLLPLVLAENNRLRAERELLERAFAQEQLPPGGSMSEQVATIAARQGITGDLGDPQVRARLLRRVDRIPPALALAQAASESGWGTSRFAHEGNNLFGERTWDASKGLAPGRRTRHTRHYVRAFPSLRDSVHSYVHNLNTHRAYAPLRALRARLRDGGKHPDAATLAGGLNRYSERGAAYVADIRTMLRHNDLPQRLQDVRLAAASSPTPH